MSKPNPYAQPCRTCRHYKTEDFGDWGRCDSLKMEVHARWTGCCRWKPKEEKST